MADPIITKIGDVSAYLDAVAHGFEGTRAEFGELLANSANYAQSAGSAASAAIAAAATATTKAGEATTAATAAQTAKTQTEAAASQALTDIGTARSGAISAVQTEGATQTANATAQAQAAATSATTASTKASEASASATTATTKATEAAASATSAANAASAAQGVLESIPEDYSDLSEDVDQLKADLDNLEDDLSTKRIRLNIKSRYYAIGSDTETIDVSSTIESSIYSCAAIDCAPGDTFTIHGDGSNTIRPYAFIDSSGNVLSKASGRTVNELVTAPENTSKIILNNRNANDFVSYYGTPLKTDIAEMVADISNLKSDFSEVGPRFTNAQKIELGKTVGVGSRYYAFIPDNTRVYTVQAANTVWVELQGYDSATFDGTKEYYSGTKTPPYTFDVSTLDQSLYYRIVFGKTGDFTIAEVASFTVYYYKNATEALNDITTSLYEHIIPIKQGSATNRYYAYINDNYRDYIVTADDAVWFALEGYTAPDYSGSSTYDSGRKYGTNRFTIEDKSLFYRVCWGITGSFTDAQIATFDCYSDSIVENKKANNADLHQSITPNSGAIISIMHGGTTVYPSNTLRLYQIAYKNGIMHWECDVRPCLDGYVLCHDDDIYNHAVTGNGEVIEQGTVLISGSTIAQLQQYKFGVITNKQADGLVSGFENQTIPTLQEYLMLAKAFGAVPIIEIKFSATQEQMAEICNIVKQFGMLESAYISGYYRASTILPMALDNGIKNISMVVNDGDASTSTIDDAYAIISPYMGQIKDCLFNATFDNANLTEASVQYAATKGMRYGAWTILANPNRQIIYNLFKIGVTAFTTNKDNINRIIADFYN